MTILENLEKISIKILGIDYWFPGHFSIYDNDSKIYQFMNAKRQQLHALNTQSQFVWFRLGENIPLKFLKPIQNSGSVLISTGQIYSKKNKEILQIEIKTFHPVNVNVYNFLFQVKELRNSPLSLINFIQITTR